MDIVLGEVVVVEVHFFFLAYLNYFLDKLKNLQQIKWEEKF